MTGQIEKVIFHGGCHGCTQQQDTGGYEICTGCRYFEADWTLPNLNNQPLSDDDIVRARLNTQNTPGTTIEQWQDYYYEARKNGHRNTARPKPSGEFFKRFRFTGRSAQ